MFTKMNKRKTCKWPNMFGQKRRYTHIPLQDHVSVCSDCVTCVSEPICINPKILDYGKI